MTDARQNHDFLRRAAARFLADEAGIRQFLDIASASTVEDIEAVDPIMMRLIAIGILLERPKAISDPLESELYEYQAQLSRELLRRRASPGPPPSDDTER